MINKLLMGIINLLTGLITAVLSPIDTLITNNLPGLSSALGAISSLLNFLADGIGWVVNISGLSSECISLIVTYYTFKLTVPILFSSIKTVIRWYNALKP